jgi:Concanavalin A-like lectin/glucanases superfamily
MLVRTETFRRTAAATAGAAGDPDLNHAINSGLVFFVGSHPSGSTGLGKERIAGNVVSLMGSATFTGTHPTQSWNCLNSPGGNADGAHTPQTSQLQGISNNLTIWADIVVDAVAAYGKIVSVPSGSTWVDPVARLLYSRDFTNTFAVYVHTDSAQRSVTGAANSFPPTAGRRRYWVTRAGATVKFGIDGAQVGADGTVNNGAISWTGGQPVTLLNRSSASPGEGIDGRLLCVRIYNRALTTTELSDLNSNPLLGVFT